MGMRSKLGVAVVALGALTIGAALVRAPDAAFAGTDHPACANRIEVNVNGPTFTVPDPEDYGYDFWVSVWTKSANNDHVSQSTIPGTVLTSGEFNQNGKEQAISHVDLCPGTPTTTTTTTTVADTTTTTTTEPATTTTTTTTEPTTTTTTEPGTTTTTTDPGTTTTTEPGTTTTTEPGTTTTTEPGTTTTSVASGGPTTTAPAATTTAPGATTTVASIGVVDPSTTVAGSNVGGPSTTAARAGVVQVLPATGSGDRQVSMVVAGVVLVLAGLALTRLGRPAH